jgi:hypothetical protein
LKGLLIASLLLCSGVAGASDLGPPGSLATLQEGLGGQRIPELKLSLASPRPSCAKARKTGDPPEIELKIRFASRGRALLWEDRVISRQKTDPIVVEETITIPLKTARTPLRFFGIDLQGGITEQPMIIATENWRPCSEETLKGWHQRSFAFSLGASALNYRETFSPDLNQWGLTGKASWSYAIVPGKWDFMLSGYLTLLALASNQPGVDIRFLGVNGRVGYTLPWFSNPWTVRLMGGAYYTTTLVRNSPIGFTNMTGPQIYPVVRRSLKTPVGSSLSFYGKYSPIFSGLGLDFRSFELATGGSWELPIGRSRSFSINVDFARLQIEIDKLFLIESNSLSLSVGFGW